MRQVSVERAVVGMRQQRNGNRRRVVVARPLHASNSRRELDVSESKAVQALRPPQPAPIQSAPVFVAGELFDRFVLMAHCLLSACENEREALGKIGRDIEHAGSKRRPIRFDDLGLNHFAHCIVSHWKTDQDVNHLLTSDTSNTDQTPRRIKDIGKKFGRI